MVRVEVTLYDAREIGAFGQFMEQVEAYRLAVAQRSQRGAEIDSAPAPTTTVDAQAEPPAVETLAAQITPENRHPEFPADETPTAPEPELEPAPEPVAPPPTQEEAVALLREFCDKRGTPEAVALLQSLGVRRVPELDDAQRTTFVAKLRDTLAA